MKFYIIGGFVFNLYLFAIFFPVLILLTLMTNKNTIKTYWNEVVVDYWNTCVIN